MAGRRRSWEQIVGSLLGEKVPEPWHGLSHFYEAWTGFGRDINGRTLYSERGDWIARNCPDPGDAEAAESLFRALEAEDVKCDRILSET